MGIPTVILGKSTDRRVFDLYNSLSKRYSTLVWDLASSNIAPFLYPNADYWVCPDVRDLIKMVAQNPAIDYVWLPLVEEEIEWLLSSAEIPSNLKFLLPSKSAFLEANDKKKFTQKFENDGLTPRSYSVKDLSANFPAEGVVVKPRIGKGAIGRYYLTSSDQLSAFMDDEVIQERLGEGKHVIGSFILASKGKVLNQYQHRRVRTFPSKGGVSICAETVQYSTVVEATAKIIKQLNWSGLCMLEFLQDQHGNYKAIECNPRIWGSVLLDEFSGNKLVDGYIMLCLGKEIQINQVRPYARISWPFPYELVHIISKPWTVFKFKTELAKATCYVGFTYSSWIRSILFILLNIFSSNKWESLFKKIVKSS